MLEIVAFYDNLDFRGCALVLGGFDGVHIGHRRLFARAKLQGVPVGVMTIVGAKGEALFTLDERLSIFREAGADFVVPFQFADICEKSAEDFLRELEDSFSPAYYVCGSDFRFGKGAKGDADTIAKVSSVPVIKENLVAHGGEKVATRSLKTMLAKGEVEGMRVLLGAPFFVEGEVVHGRSVGRKMGFPTANIFYPKGKALLMEGVYGVRASVDGKAYKGIANFGGQPTFDETQVRLEVHLDGYKGDLYGRVLKVEFCSFLRPVQKFQDLQALKAQLESDIRKVREDD